ncbi:hypothetical protein IBX65_02755 [Candidatus Aerophobetes bacterium]|nr:hypothetical protein [Candidatus Aerophobetes bacterium]
MKKKILGKTNLQGTEVGMGGIPIMRLSAKESPAYYRKLEKEYATSPHE